MNPENNDFSNFEEEIANKAENKEKKEFVNLSFMLASDLIKQIESGGKPDLRYLNKYQRSCEHIVIHNKNTNKYDRWYLEDDYRFSKFLDELPSYYEKSSDKDMKIFFCNSEYDIPLDNEAWKAEDDGEKALHFLTPNGVPYREDYIKRIDENGKEDYIFELSYSDTKQLSPEEVRKQIEIAKNKLNKNFKEYTDGTFPKW